MNSFAQMHNDHLDPDRWMDSCDEGQPAPTLTPAQTKQVARLRSSIEKARHEAFSAPREPITKESLFEGCPDGDFSWEGEPEDVGNAWNCGDEDCESGGWHCSVNYIEQGRENGKTWFIVMEDNISGSGDYQPVAGWDEREGDEVSESILSDLWFHLHGRSIEHFYGWAKYCIDVAVTGQDPLDNWCFHKRPTFENAISAAKDNLRYLRMKK